MKRYFKVIDAINSYACLVITNDGSTPKGLLDLDRVIITELTEQDYLDWVK